MTINKNNIYILLLGDMDLVFLKELEKDLEKIFDFEFKLRNRVEIPEYAYSKENGKYNGRIILNELSKLNLVNCEKILAITDQDLFTEDLNYIFGLAETGGRNCIISIKRLDPQFYNKREDEGGVFYARILKEAMHELGHAFSLKHCQNKKCVMYFSNSIEETDKKESGFCEKCEEKYKYINF